jgi:hypothetical protein
MKNSVIAALLLAMAMPVAAVASTTAKTHKKSAVVAQASNSKEAAKSAPTADAKHAKKVKGAHKASDGQKSTETKK